MKKNRLIAPLLIAAVIALAFVFYMDEVRDEEPTVQFTFDAGKIVATREKQLWVREKDPAHVAEALERLPGIVCWGDSLTAGVGGYGYSYPLTLAEKLAKNGYVTTTVANMGVAGESTREIRARAGVFNLILQEEITIPAECEPVQVSFLASDGYGVKLLIQGNAGVENVSIKGIEGTLSVRFEPELSYWFTRHQAGRETSVMAGTPIINDGSYLYKDYLPIIFMGHNGTWGDNPQELIRQLNEMIDAHGRNKDKFLILGLTSDTAAERKELESAMEAEWGRQFVNLRAGLCDAERIVKAGLPCTEEDLAAIAIGQVPPVLLYDPVHLTATGYMIMGELVYERLVELEFLEK